ncbi:MAG TPA: WYL domain-containing protein [Lachnospiraceae bacterium]|nr:WYL domain-containing protein [Lachnospiraceae bacterium]
MANKTGQKLKLLYVMNILLNETDENHPLNANEIIDRLNEMGVDAERKSIYSDISTLLEYGLNIEKSEEYKGGYYIADKSFELAELKLLVDAISSSRFISEKKAKDLVDRIAGLGNVYDARELSRQVVVPNRNQGRGEKTFYAIDTIYRCIDENHKMSFKYFKWNAKKEKEFKYDGERITVSPACLMWFDENYYLVAYSDKREDIRYYRVDKMESVEEIDELREGIADIDRKRIAQIARNSFGMYQGETRTVNIVCDSSIVGVFIDRFGYDIDITEKGNKARVRIELEVSPQFYGWISGLGDKAYIEGPKDIRDEYKDYIKALMKNY